MYRLDGRRIGVRFFARANDFSLFHTVQTGSATHPAIYPEGSVVTFSGKAITHLSLRPKIKNARSRNSTLPHMYLAWFLVKQRDKFAFTFYNNNNNNNNNNK